jgi:hypothetical protein
MRLKKQERESSLKVKLKRLVNYQKGISQRKLANKFTRIKEP